MTPKSLSIHRNTQPSCKSSSTMTPSSSHSCKWVRPQRLLPVTLAFLLLLSLVVSDPVERASAPVLLLDIALPPMTAKQYMDTFWNDANFYKDFLKESGDRNVDIQPWSPAPSSPLNNNNKHHKHHKRQQLRTVVTKHPVKTRTPGIPSHVKSTKTQTLSEEEGGEGGKKGLHLIKVHETNVVEGVPFADRFYVVLVWTATWGEAVASGSSSSSSSSSSTHSHHSHHWGRRDSKADSSKTTVRLTVHQHVVFKRPFWLEKVVEKDAASETLTTLKLWSLLAHQKMAVPVDGKSPTPFATPPEKEGGTTTKSKCRLVSVAKHVLLTGFLTSLVVLVTRGAAYVPGFRLVNRSGGQTKSE